MTDKKDPVVTTYPLIGEGGKVVPGNQEEQLIDLDAAYKKTGETKTNELVEGLERYINQKILGKREMELAGVKGGENFDPLPSKRNAVLGGESFITAVKDGFLKIIDFIIKFIKGAVNWVIERIKVLLGFSKTKAEIKACEDARSDMEKEVKSTLSGFGINPSFYSLDQLVESAPRGIDRVEMIKYLSAKSKNETEMVKALTGVIPDLTTLTRKLRDSSDSLTKRYKRFKVVLDSTRKKLAANNVGDADGYELSKAIKDVMVISEDYGDVVASLSAVVSKLYGVNLDDSKILKEGFGVLRENIARNRAVATSKLNPEKLTGLYAEIGTLNNRIISESGNAFDLSHVDTKVLKEVVSLDDANFINNLSDVVGNRQLIADYQAMAVSVRDFTAILESSSAICADISREIANFTKWKNNVDMYLAVAVTEDLKLIASTLIASAGAGEYDLDKLGKSKPVVLPEPGLVKKTGLITQEILDADLHGVTSAVNNFAKTAGLNVRVKPR